MNLPDLRINYGKSGLIEADADASPFVQFRAWLADAIAAGVPEPNAMTLATCTADGLPSARVVLLKGFDERGAVFFTNDHSRKGAELLNNPRAALVFFWPDLERQIRVEGTVEKAAPEEGDEYFQTRPRNSRLGAWASEQSAVIAGRAELEARHRELELRFPDEDVPRPPHWGGYRVTPSVFEFWQGRPSRLHDRLRYRLDGGQWIVERLSP